MTSEPRGLPVAAVIPTWNGWDDTRRCLESLRSSSPGPARIRVVDNGSSDGTPDRLREEWPTVELLALPENLGFSRAVNLAIEPLLSEPAIEAVFLLNNDVVVDPDALGRLWNTLSSHQNAAGVCPLITYVDPADRVWYGGGVVALWRGYVGHRHIRARVESASDGERDTDYVTGAAVLLRSSALREVGILDERYPFYAEDVDWSLRAREAGWHLLLNTGSRVAHRVSASLGGPFSARKLRAKARAMRLLFGRHALPWHYLTVLPCGLLLTLPQTVAGLLRARGRTA